MGALRREMLAENKTSSVCDDEIYAYLIVWVKQLIINTDSKSIYLRAFPLFTLSLKQFIDRYYITKQP